LRARYARQAVGQSEDGSEGWFNWILRLRSTKEPVGTVQATLTARPGGVGADLAWVVAVAQQGRGYASEAVQAMADWLRRLGVVELSAYVHPDHAASAAVARHAGLRPTEVIVGGELRWTSIPPAGPS
jgi:RimJ/RimL family protein N-acetyltransferase